MKRKMVYVRPPLTNTTTMSLRHRVGVWLAENPYYRRILPVGLLYTSSVPAVRTDERKVKMRHIVS